MVIGGLVFATLGGLVWLIGRAFPDFRFGRLPGDIVVERPGFGFYFPVTTLILVSAVVTLVMWLIALVRK